MWRPNEKNIELTLRFLSLVLWLNSGTLKYFLAGDAAVAFIRPFFMLLSLEMLVHAAQQYIHQLQKHYENEF